MNVRGAKPVNSVATFDKSDRVFNRISKWQKGDRMNLKLFLVHGLIKEFHKSKIRRILARTDIGDEAKMLLIADSLNWLKANDEAYNLVDIPRRFLLALRLMIYK